MRPFAFGPPVRAGPLAPVPSKPFVPVAAPVIVSPVTFGSVFDAPEHMPVSTIVSALPALASLVLKSAHVAWTVLA